MRNWTIGRRIAAGYAVLIVLLLATAVVGDRSRCARRARTSRAR